MISETHQKARAPRAFFGRRKGHALRPQQAELFARLLPALSLDLAVSAPGDLSTLFPARVDTVRLEIGFGGGEHLIAQAQQNPSIGFIGCEPFVNGVAKALSAIDTHILTNIRLHHGDAIELLAWLPPRSISRIDLLYPDPWPKKRHWKRRLVQKDRIEEFARILAPGSDFRFASDIEDYVAWTLSMMLRSGSFAWTAQRANDWRLPWPDFVRTRYETKALREGRTPCYLTFRRRRLEDGSSLAKPTPSL
jgi:tRNA (guanine-N7-)-methyltransferase